LHFLFLSVLERFGERMVPLLLGAIAGYWLVLVLWAWHSGAIARLVAR